MIDEKYIIKTIHSVISKNSKCNLSALVIGQKGIPQYNNGLNQPKICSLGLNVCKEFYKSHELKTFFEKQCPFGFNVSKKTIQTNTKYKAIIIFNILSFIPKKEYNELLKDLPRKIKAKREEIIINLNNYSLEENIQIEFRDYLESLIYTLLAGRIGLAIQTLSHQIFTPLQGAMSDLNNIYDNIDVEESTKRLRTNLESLSKVATEVQLLLSSSTQFNPNMVRRVVVHTMVTNIFNGLISLANEKNITLRQGFNSFSKTVSAIPEQLHIVLSNIIHNAIKYSFNGYPTSPLEVLVQYSQNLENLEISIINEGCKITSDEIKDELLFDLGYRGKFSNDRQRKGTGSGLYICREIVESHGGYIKVKSEYAGGAKEQNTVRYKNCFTIIWPIFHDY